MKTKYKVIDKNGVVVSIHSTKKDAIKAREKRLRWWCNICKFEWMGWAGCSHRLRSQGCESVNYADRIQGIK